MFSSSGAYGGADCQIGFVEIWTLCINFSISHRAA